MSSPAPIIEAANEAVQDLFVPFRSADSSPKVMQDTVHALTNHVVAAAKTFDSTLTSTTLIPVLRGGLPMFVAAQPLFTSSSCVLVRCSKAKGSDAVIVEWSGRAPFPQEPDDGRIVILDTIIATGDTIVRLCDELWESSGRRARSVVIMCCYAAPDALDRLANHPVVQYVVVAQKAEKCDSAGYLVPYTHGDIGDKIFGISQLQASPVIADGQDVEAVTQSLHGLLRQSGGEWSLTPDGSGIERDMKFKTFKSAWAFMGRIADEAAKHRHHPEWSNVYNKVSIRWTTHEPKGLTQKDVDLARLSDEHCRDQLI